jgi:hypothetical protein
MGVCEAQDGVNMGEGVHAGSREQEGAGRSRREEGGGSRRRVVRIVHNPIQPSMQLLRMPMPPQPKSHVLPLTSPPSSSAKEC